MKLNPNYVSCPESILVIIMNKKQILGEREKVMDEGVSIITKVASPDFVSFHQHHQAPP